MRRRSDYLFPILAGLISAGVLVLALGAWRAAAQTADPQAAADFLSALQDRAVEELIAENASLDERGERFRLIFRENFDLDAIGKFVVGRYWRGAADQERTDFLAVFEDVMVQRFLPLLTHYTGEKFQIAMSKEDSRNKDMVLVTTRLARDEGEPYRVNWRIRLKGGSFKVLDIIAEGVSMAITLRSEYNSVLKTSGGSVTALTDALREKLENGDFEPQLE